MEETFIINDSTDNASFDLFKEHKDECVFLRATSNLFNVSNLRNQWIGIGYKNSGKWYMITIFYNDTITPSLNQEAVGYSFSIDNVDFEDNFETFIPTNEDITKYNTYISIAKDLGYNGNSNFPTFIEIVNSIVHHIPVNKEIGSTINLSIKKIDKDPKIIEKMIKSVDMSRLIKLFSIAGNTFGSSDKIRYWVKKETIDTYLKRWAVAKYEMFLLFGEKLAISTDVEIEKTPQIFMEQVSVLAKQYPKYGHTLMYGFSKDEYKENTITGHSDRFDFYMPQTTVYGMKVTKFLSGLFNDEKFDIDLSKIYQDKTVKGLVTISIDPYDYLTASINKHNWHSCHNIIDGCYATGGFSYMCDESTMIAYRHNGLDYDYDIHGAKFTGNSKQWRQMVYFDKNTCSAIFSRQYPDKNLEIIKAVRQLLENQVSTYLSVSNTWKLADSKHEGEFNFNYHYAYDDIENGYEYRFIKHKELPSDKDIYFDVGSKVYCLYCGDVLEDTGDDEVACCHKS